MPENTAELLPILFKDNEKEIDASFNTYRQSGLGLSATLIALDVLMAKVLFREVVHPSTSRCLFTLAGCLAFLVAILSSVFIQVFNYWGQMLKAERWFPKGIKLGPEWIYAFGKMSQQSNEWFTRSRIALNVSLVSSIISLVFLVCRWLFAY